MVLMMLCLLTMFQERTTADPGVRKALEDAIQTVTEGLAAGEAEQVPVRLPTGDRGQRIDHYAELARADQRLELGRLLLEAGEAPAPLREILSGISRSENKALLPLVQPYLKMANPEVRAAAVLAHGKCGTTADIATIEPLLEDTNLVVRAAAQMAIDTIRATDK